MLILAYGRLLAAAPFACRADVRRKILAARLRLTFRTPVVIIYCHLQEKNMDPDPEPEPVRLATSIRIDFIFNTVFRPGAGGMSSSLH